jgi:phosphoribosylanthranilate isomerase
MQTRIKICGITRDQDLHDAVEAGADAIGFVQYAPSPRAVSLTRLGALSSQLPAFVTPVLLYVNAEPQAIEAGLRCVPNATLQFHGEETAAECERWGRPYLKAARIPDPAQESFDLLQYALEFATASAILLDAKIDAYGGGGHTFNWAAFDWSQPQLNASTRLVLSGGLTPANVTDGIKQVKTWAVDVSSGVETAKGIKDRDKIWAFVRAVRLTA